MMGIKKGNELLNIATFADKLESAYLKAGDNNKKAAKKLGMDSTALSKLKNGNKAVTVDDLIKISRAYGCSVDDLIGVKERVTEVHSKKITARDLCRVLADIEMTWGFEAKYQPFTFSKNAINEFYNTHRGGSPAPIERVWLSLPLGMGEYEDWVEEDGDLRPYPLYSTDCLIGIHRFIKKLMQLKKISGLDDEMKEALIEKYLQAVAENDLPPDHVY